MKKIALIFALAFALTTGITVIVADVDLARADSAGTVVTHPEQTNICDDTAC